jgi:putative DNA primase/helicase
MSPPAIALRSLALALGGEISGKEVLAPGPGHSAIDRSLSITIARDGDLIVNSFSGDGWRECLDYVRSRAGLPAFRSGLERRRPVRREEREPRRQSSPGYALRLWGEARTVRGTAGEIYLRRDRQLDCIEYLSHCLRWHEKLGALIALFRDIKTGEPRAASRILLDAEGHKIERKFLGPVSGCAVKVSADEDVTMGLFIAEGSPQESSAYRPFGRLARLARLQNSKSLAALKRSPFLRRKKTAARHKILTAGATPAAKSSF